MNCRKLKKRSLAGASLAEISPVLWILFMLLLFPLINLATISLRYTFLVIASRDAADAAAQSPSFMNDLPGQPVSAVHNADRTARRIAASFSGVTIDAVNTSILVTSIASQQVTSQDTPLQQPADTKKNIYNIQALRGIVWVNLADLPS